MSKEALRKKFDRFQALEVDWYEKGSVPTTQDAIDEAWAVLESPPFNTLPVDDKHLFPAPHQDGGVGFEWTLDDGTEVMLDIPASRSDDLTLKIFWPS